jgi:hypothetical protein
MTASLLSEMRSDLHRPHAIAFERVGFLACRGGQVPGGFVLVAHSWLPVADAHYAEGAEDVGAAFGPDAIRLALEHAYNHPDVMLFVHEHSHPGMPRPSRVDKKCWATMIPNFWHVSPSLPHGALILSEDDAMGLLWIPGADARVEIDDVVVVGPRLTRQGKGYPMRDHDSRQSFLGESSESILQNTTVGIVGLGGGGSHIAQQLAHIGIGGYVLADPQTIEDTNLNRLVGATADDVLRATPKVQIAERLIKGIRPGARVTALQSEWQKQGEQFRGCDAIFGCSDSFSERAQLERMARRYLIPYIDIGMDVHAIEGGGSHISGQIALSLPGGPCMWCMAVLTDARIAEEVARYGAAGARQQVVWPNGVLASSAVGMFVRLVTPWTSQSGEVLLEYDGNKGTVVESMKISYLPSTCTHFTSPDDLGDPFFNIHEK